MRGARRLLLLLLIVVIVVGDAGGCIEEGRFLREPLPSIGNIVSCVTGFMAGWICCHHRRQHTL